MANYITVDFGTALQGKANGKMVPAFDVACEDTPSKLPEFVWPAWSKDLLLWWGSAGTPLYITGPSGCGKTQAVKQLASMLNYPVYEVTGHNRLETPELVGHYVLQGQATVWQDGPLTRAMKTGGIFLLNEVDLLDPSTAAGLNTVLDGAPLRIPETNECIPPHDGFRFVATANTAGSGDFGGLYQGTLRMNAAFMDRFAVLMADYLPMPAEEGLLKRVYPKLSGAMRTAICSMANRVRALYTRDESLATAGLDEFRDRVNLPLSTRTVLRWAEWAELCMPMARKGVNVLEYSMMRAFGFRCDPAMQVALRELLQRVTPSASENNN